MLMRGTRIRSLIAGFADPDYPPSEWRFVLEESC